MTYFLTHRGIHVNNVGFILSYCDNVGVRTIVPEENCPPVRIRVWFRVSVKIRFGAGGQFSSGAIVLEPIMS